MDLMEAMKNRHSVRQYADRPIGAKTLSALREEIASARRRYDEQTELLRDERVRRLRRAERVLRSNPTASSRRHVHAMELLREHGRKDGGEDRE